MSRKLLNKYLQVENNKVEVREINLQKQLPVIEAYIGEYASGKSENAINRAVYLAEKKRKVTLVDLDLVEPFYTLRPLKKMLEKEKGIDVIAWETRETMGLGEAGSILKPEMKWIMRRSGDIIMDIGYGIEGAKIINLVENAQENPFLKFYLVVNIARPITAEVGDIVTYAKGMGRIDALINNSHLGDETDIEIVQEGAKVVSAAAKELGLPVLATAVTEDIALALGSADCMGNPLQIIKRYMKNAFW